GRHGGRGRGTHLGGGGGGGGGARAAPPHGSGTMALIDQVLTVCRKLVGKGWDVLLKTGYGLDIDQPDAASLQAELAKPLTRKTRFAGFEDFADTDIAGVKPVSPPHSLLYHALASPNVLNDVNGN